MYKKYLKLLVVLSTIFLLLSTNIISFAEEVQSDINTDNSAVTNEDQTQTQENSTEQNNEQQSSEETTTETEELVDIPAEDLTSESGEIVSNDSTSSENDVTINEKEVEINYNIEGNLFIRADKVTIKSGVEIQGDAFIFADELVVEENAFILSNLFALAKNIDFRGSIYSIYASADKISISGIVSRDFKALSSGNINISGNIGRDAVIYGTSNISFTNPNENDESTPEAQGIIIGKLKYYAQNELDKGSIPDDVLSEGSIEYHNLSGNNKFLSCLLSLANSLILLVALWFIGKWLAPKFTDKSGIVLSKRQPVANFLMGLLILVAIPILALMFIILQVTIKLSIFLLGLYTILLAISSSIFIISLTKVICDKTEVESISGKLIRLLVVGVILNLITFIPVVGIIVKIFMIILGLGISINYLFNTKTENDIETMVDSKSSNPPKKSRSESDKDDEKPSIHKKTK